MGKTDLVCPICLNEIVLIDSKFMCIDDTTTSNDTKPLNNTSNDTPLNKTITLSCDHIMCLVCYHNALKFLRPPVCPICRTRIHDTFYDIQIHVPNTTNEDNPTRPIPEPDSNWSFICTGQQKCFICCMLSMIIFILCIFGIYKGVVTL